MKVVITSFCVFGYLEWPGSYLNIKSNVLSLKKKAKKICFFLFFHECAFVKYLVEPVLSFIKQEKGDTSTRLGK